MKARLFIQKIIEKHTPQIIINLAQVISNRKDMWSSIRAYGMTSLSGGNTDAPTLIIHLDIPVVCKLDPKVVPNEIIGYEILSKGIPNHVLPVILSDTDIGLLVIPYLDNAQDLHTIIQEQSLSDEDLLRVFDDIINKMYGLWVNSAAPGNAAQQYIARIRRRTDMAKESISLDIEGERHTFEEILTMPLVINGEEYPPLKEQVEEAIRFLKKNKTSLLVTSHRDEHLKNILVELQYPESHVRHWYLVDLPNVEKRSDWVYTIGKMLHWLDAYYAIDILKRRRSGSSQTTVRYRNGKLHVDYSLATIIPPIMKKLRDKVVSLGEWMGEWSKDEGWKVRLHVAEFVKALKPLLNLSSDGGDKL